MPVKAMPMAAPVASWTGFYLGAGGGYGMFDSDHTSSLDGFVLPQSTIGGKGWFGTVQVGGDYQFAERWVVGAFGDFDFSDIKGTASELISTSKFPLNQRNAYAAGGRIGYLVCDARHADPRHRSRIGDGPHRARGLIGIQQRQACRGDVRGLARE
jgi:outer membrane immunogenic protein